MNLEEKKEKMTHRQMRNGFVGRAYSVFEDLRVHFEGTGNECMENEDSTWLDKALKYCRDMIIDLERAKSNEEQE